jgi:superfamily II DNA helicase RecQ
MELQIRKAMKKHFGYDGYKPGQEEVIKSILQAHDTLGVMPTGGGKSLCYQLPAMVLPGITVVISPLIALMKDQVDALNDQGVPALSFKRSLSSCSCFWRTAADSLSARALNRCSFKSANSLENSCSCCGTYCRAR